MKVTRYLKFLPLLAIFAFGVVLISMPDDTEATPLGAPSLSLTILPINGSTVVTAMYTDDTPAGSANAVLTASPAIGTFLSPATLTPLAAETVTVSGATVTVSEDADTLANQKTLTATFQCQTFGTTTFTVSHGGTTSPASVTLYCGDYGGQYYPGYPGGYPGYPSYPGAYPTYPINPGTVSAVTVAASPASTSCTSPSTISVTVKDSTGNLVTNGTSVTVSASTGTVSPNVVSTSGGYATTTFTAPDNTNGTATVTATAGTGTGYATVAFTCTSGSTTTAAAAPIYVPPPVYDYYPSGPVSIMPPNTGDAGLAQNAGTTSGAGIALVALSILGAGAGAMKLRQQHIER